MYLNYFYYLCFLDVDDDKKCVFKEAHAAGWRAEECNDDDEKKYFLCQHTG